MIKTSSATVFIIIQSIPIGDYSIGRGVFQVIMHLINIAGVILT